MNFQEILRGAQKASQDALFNIGKSHQQGGVPNVIAQSGPDLFGLRAKVNEMEQKERERMNERAQLGKQKREKEAQLEQLLNPQLGPEWVPQAPETTVNIQPQQTQDAQPTPTPQQILGVAVTPTPAPQEVNFDDILQRIFEQATARGFHPAAIMGQAATESGRGTSNFAQNRNNYFGLGAFDYNLDNTWGFNHPYESIDAVMDLYEKDPRYAAAYENRHNPLKLLEEAKAAGYARDPNYVWEVTNTPEYRMGAEATRSGQLAF
jgi:flagellum-specific peptidoglycan hydrolase FlgJ